MNPRWYDPLTAPLPGIALCLLVTGGSFVVQKIEILYFGRAWLESLVLAILLGCAVRSCLPLSPRFAPGIQFGAKFLLEVAVVLLGASVSAKAIAGEGFSLVAGIAAVVVLAVCASYAICRTLKLPHRMALLIACGNSICGNSAIAAVAPVIGAGSEDVAASIAFTAVLGVLVVIALPMLAGRLGFSTTQFGVFAGLTVYAVPQVLAATASGGLLSVQVGTLVKLIRVLMLGPVVLVLGLTNRRGSESRPPLAQMLPWFIVGFLVLMGLRSSGWLPARLDAPIGSVATLMTVVSMAALGLGVDVRSVARAGLRVTGAVTLSLLLLGTLGIAAIKLLAVV
ncbi:MAG: Conserved hypothetical integral rane protein [Herbaspirillum sp.]|nr:Conserved hypothetical integral rane protein [Herbaspirillum sp.]